MARTTFDAEAVSRLSVSFEFAASEIERCLQAVTRSGIEPVEQRVLGSQSVVNQYCEASSSIGAGVIQLASSLRCFKEKLLTSGEIYRASEHAATMAGE